MSEPQQLNQEEELAQAHGEEQRLLNHISSTSLTAAALNQGVATVGGSSSISRGPRTLLGAAWRSGPFCMLGSAFAFACAAALVKGVEHMDPRVSLFQVGARDPLKPSGGSTHHRVCHDGRMNTHCALHGLLASHNLFPQIIVVRSTIALAFSTAVPRDVPLFGRPPFRLLAMRGLLGALRKVGSHNLPVSGILVFSAVVSSNDALFGSREP